MTDSTRSDDGGQEPYGRSGIIEHMRERAGLEGNMYNRLYPVVLDVSHVEHTDDAFRISDRDGCVPTSEEFWPFVDHIARFYHLVDDAEIEAYNKRVRQDRQRSIEESARVPEQSDSRKPEAGYVYVLAGGGYYKIGRAKDPEKRFAALAIQLPYEVRPMLWIRSSDYKTTEAELHEHFAAKRLNGEWFDLSDEDLGYIKGLGE